MVHTPAATALLVIDMQKAWLRTVRFDQAQVLNRINRAAQHLREQGGRVVFIRHCNEEAPLGSPGWALDAALQVQPGDDLVDKTVCDSFAHTGLLARLREVGVTRLLISGLCTEFCVDSTVRAAASLGFGLTVLADAHTTGDRPHLSAERIIEHHNWVWANLALPRGQVLQVLPTDRVLCEGV